MENTTPSINLKRNLLVIGVLVILAAFALVFSAVSTKLASYQSQKPGSITDSNIVKGENLEPVIGGQPNGFEVKCSPRSNELKLTPGATAFMLKLQQKKVSESGFHPIEGFEPSMYLSSIGTLRAEDFQCVEAAQGYYKVQGGVVTFVPTVAQNMLHTAARAITSVGHGTLIENIAKRLNMKIDTDADIQKVQDVIIK
jgi:hypothetical protein